MTSNETVHSPVLSTCLSVTCIALETVNVDHALAYRNNWETKSPFAGDEGILLHGLR